MAVSTLNFGNYVLTWSLAFVIAQLGDAAFELSADFISGHSPRCRIADPFTSKLRLSPGKALQPADENK